MAELTITISSTLSFDHPDPDRAPNWWSRPHGYRSKRRFMDALRTACTFQNPAYERAKRSGRGADPDKQFICLLTEERDRTDIKVHVPRGMIGAVRKAATKARLDIIWDTDGVQSLSDRPESAKAFQARLQASSITPRPYQDEIVEAILKRRQGVVVLPCGGGKTFTGLLAAWRSGESVLVLVHTEDLLEQWVDSAHKLTGRAPRVINADHKDGSPLRAGEFCVAMVKTLKKQLEHPFGAREMRPMMNSVGFLMVDECHHVPAQTFSAVVNQCPARYRIGLSATPDRADGFGFLLGALIGPRLYMLQTQELITQGYLRRPLIIPVQSSYSPSYSAREWTLTCPACAESGNKRRRARATHTISSERKKKLFQDGKLRCDRFAGRNRCGHTFTGRETFDAGKLVSSQVITECQNNPARLRLMADLVLAGLQQKRSCLSLVTRREAVGSLVGLLGDLGVPRDRLRGVTGKTKKTDRRAMIARFRSGRYDSLTATQLADEGLDVPRLDYLVMGSAGRHDGTAQQRAGRTSRLDGHAVPIVLDIVDSYPGARSQWRARAAAYRDAYGPQGLPCASPLPPAVAHRVVQALADVTSTDEAICAYREVLMEWNQERKFPADES